MNKQNQKPHGAAKPAASKPNPDAVVSAVDLHKTYRMGKVSLEVLRGISFDVKQGEFVGIYGHSGSGKSTLLHLLGLLDKPTSGSVYLDSVDLGGLSRGRQNEIRCNDIGFIFQFYYLLPELTVLENTTLSAMIANSTGKWIASRKEQKQKAADLLNELGLGDRLKHKPKELSGGEQQRVAIARGLIHNPKLLLADEPTGNLDSKTGEKIMNVLLRFNREHKQTILMVTHDEDLIGQVTRSISIKDGKLLGK
ncbi:MAG: ABC transporter ATP-binding protein [Phycisphaerae bacterium]|nr:ABC transporter ATP-binding protein [Phycisphaerae bacterium]